METKDNKESQPAESSNLDDLESQTTVVTEDSTNGSVDATEKVEGDEASTDKKSEKSKKRRGVKGLANRINIYLLGFILVILLAGVVSFVSYQKSKSAEKKQDMGSVNTTPLSEEELKKLRQSDVKVGDPKQVLSVESNAIFAGKVLIRDSLEVAGQIKVGGPLNLPGISVSGTSNFDQVSINNLQISGSATIQGQLNVQNNLAVSGSLTVGGTLSAAKLNIQTIQISGDLQLARHIDAGGGTPGKVDGGALGGGGTSSVSGTDTAGTVTINTGGGTAPGCFVTVSFTQKFNGVPHVVVSPIGPAAANLEYYVNRTQTNFSICTANAAAVGQNFSFDYVAID